MVVATCVWSEYHEQALLIPGCISIPRRSLARRSNACSGEPDHADAAQEWQVQLLMVRMSFWPRPLDDVQHQPKRRRFGAYGCDLRQCRLLARHNRPLVRAKSNCDVVSIGWRRGPTDARERRPTQLRIKRPARRSPVRAFLESVNLVTSASLDRSKLAGTKGLQSWTSSGSAAVLHLPVPETERLAGDGRRFSWPPDNALRV